MIGVDVDFYHNKYKQITGIFYCENLIDGSILLYRIKFFKGRQ